MEKEKATIQKKSKKSYWGLSPEEESVRIHISRVEQFVFSEQLNRDIRDGDPIPVDVYTTLGQLANFRFCWVNNLCDPGTKIFTSHTILDFEQTPKPFKEFGTIEKNINTNPIPYNNITYYM